MEYLNTKGYTLLPNTFENIIPNIFINATIKTFGVVLCAQGLYYVYWKRNFSYNTALRYLQVRRVMVIPFAYFWYRQLKIELDNLNVSAVVTKESPLEQKKEHIIPIYIKKEVVEPSKEKNIKLPKKAELIELPEEDKKQIFKDTQTKIGKLISLNYIIK
jgi:hypothetical protein